jgi:7-keto-8-aminopelargonate synthetase-like enzyme
MGIVASTAMPAHLDLHTLHAPPSCRRDSMSAGVFSSAQPVLNFCANNYLGLGNHPKVIEAAKRGLDSHGFGLASVRFICGTQDLHKQLESSISRFHCTQDTILYASCFDANAGLFETLLTAEDAVISDTLNHASIIDGIRLCKVRTCQDLTARALTINSVAARVAAVRLTSCICLSRMATDASASASLVRGACWHDVQHN